MILREWAESRRGELVYIGIRSAYVFMDKVGDDFEMKLAMLSADEFIKTQQLLNQYRKKVSTIDERYEVLRKRNEQNRKEAEKAKAENRLSKNTAKIYTDKELTLRKASEALRLKRKVASLESQLNNFVGFLDRKVISEYPSFMTKATICLLEGEESGKYWMIEEYKNPELLNQYKGKGEEWED